MTSQDVVIFNSYLDLLFSIPHQKINSVSLDKSYNSFMAGPQSEVQCLTLNRHRTVACKMDPIQEAFGKFRMKTLLDLVSAFFPLPPSLGLFFIL